MLISCSCDSLSEAFGVVEEVQFRSGSERKFLGGSCSTGGTGFSGAINKFGHVKSEVLIIIIITTNTNIESSMLYECSLQRLR